MPVVSDDIDSTRKRKLFDLPETLPTILFCSNITKRFSSIGKTYINKLKVYIFKQEQALFKEAPLKTADYAGLVYLERLVGWSGGRFWPILANRGLHKDQFIYLIKGTN